MHQLFSFGDKKMMSKRAVLIVIYASVCQIYVAIIQDASAQYVQGQYCKIDQQYQQDGKCINGFCYKSIVNYNQQSNIPNQKSKIRVDESVLDIFHFNDVYDIQQGDKEPKAGVAYFKSLLERYRKQYQRGDNILTLFSGDAFAPALLSTQYRGKNMIKPLNSLKIDLACVGNHDLDYPLTYVMQLHKATNFQWLLSNIINIKTGRRMVQGLEYKIIQKKGIKIGIFSLAQEQWIVTLKTYYHDISKYIPYVPFAKKMVQLLKNQLKCDILIVLSHMMKYNDVKLAEAVPGIDLILGGHDHLIFHQKVYDSCLVKSGTNFEHFSIVSVYQKGSSTKRTKDRNVVRFENSRWAFQVKLVQVHHQNEKIQPDAQLNAYVHDIYNQFAQDRKAVAIYTRKQVDLRFKTIRVNNSPFLELLTSFFMNYMGAECAIFNNGCFRTDKLIPPGPITFGQITSMIQDQLVVKSIPGKDIVLALQNMLSLYPNLSGRFSSVSGIYFVWNSTAPPYQRVIKQTILINGEPLQQQRIYRVCLTLYMAGGGDGFSSFKFHPILQSHQQFTDIIGLGRKLHDLQDKDVKALIQRYPNYFAIKQVNFRSYLQLLLMDSVRIKMV